MAVNQALDTPILDEFEALGFRCVVRQAPRSINGYVQVPPGHWAFQADPFDRGPLESVDVHGGITWADDEGWIGFDTAHAGDFDADLPHLGGTVWTVAMVRRETERLAAQLASAPSAPPSKESSQG